MARQHRLIRHEMSIEDRRYPVNLTIRSEDLLRLDRVAATLNTTRATLIRRCISDGLPVLENETKPRR